MNTSSRNAINETVLYTPKPQASSTVIRTHVKKELICKPVPIDFTTSKEKMSSISSESLNLLNVNELNLTRGRYVPSEDQSWLTSNSSRASTVSQKQGNASLDKDIIDRWRKQTFLAEDVPNSVNEIQPLYSHFDNFNNIQFDHNNRESTISESDLVRQSTEEYNIGFNPHSNSTLRNTDLSTAREVETSVTDNICQISEKIRNSDISVKELCSQFGSSVFTTQNAENDAFMPTEFAKYRLDQDEINWWNEKCMSSGLVKDRSFFETTGMPARKQKQSLSEFFKGMQIKIIICKGILKEM